MTLQSIRDITDEQMIPCIAAVVALHDGESTHYVLNDEGQLQISVKTHRGQQINAILSLDADSDGGGIWRVPALGTEVLVVFNEGDFEGDGYLVGKHPGRITSLPTGLAPGTTVVQDGAVLVRGIGGTAVALALKSDVDALAAFVSTLSLPVVGGGGGTAGPPAGTVPTAAGTTVLKGQ